jgi:hypothetical protein
MGMPFEALETIARDARVPMASVSYERPWRKGKERAGLPVLIIAVPTTLAGLCKRDRFRFEIGTGTDAGKARVCGLAKGTVGTSAPGTMMEECAGDPLRRSSGARRGCRSEGTSSRPQDR